MYFLYRMQNYNAGIKRGLRRQPNEPKKMGQVLPTEVTYCTILIVGHASFRCASGFHTSSASPVNVFVFGLILAASFSKRFFSFFPFSLRPFLLCPPTSASSAAALSNPRSVKPSRRLAARATRYRVLTRAGAGVRLGRLRVGEDKG